MILNVFQCVPKTWHPAHFFDIPEQIPTDGVSVIYPGGL